ncbi:unnamed protein product [Paramecium pentaurelia]|uniref:t-SNARE coiled-coil homology domain-containing protein n=1 Tax=Paramecium pentaurelia TaxID=43138 RepID=A0A8S1S301_9CILI|nr:unnamed protein product [Paramecium pentaurelia]
MDDRLIELYKMSGRQDSFQLNNSNSSQENEFMPQFTAKINKAQQCLKRIKENNIRMQDMSVKYSSATTSYVEEELSRELEQIMVQNQQFSNQLKEALKDIKEDVEKSERDENDQTEIQIKINQRNALTNKVQEVLQASQQISIKYKTCVREKIRRQTKILDQNTTEELLNEICNDPQRATQLLQNKLYGEVPSIGITNAVSDIQEKYKDIQQLEKSVQLVSQLFVDLAILVHAQGQGTDNIELNLDSAKTYVGKSEKNFIMAKNDHKAAKKKICCIILIGIIILAVIIGPIVATL